MNFTELFIRRPVMTTLVMAGILIFGMVAYRQLPVSDLPAVDYPTISVSASLSGRESRRPWRRRWRRRWRSSSPPSPGVETMTSTSTPGQHLDHAAVRAQPRHRRRRAGRAGGDLAGPAHAAAGHAAAELPEGRPVGIADPVLRHCGPRPCRCPSSTSTPRTRSGPAALHGRRRGAGPGVRLAEVRGADPARSPGSSRRAASASTRSRPRSRTATSTCPTGILWGTDKAYSVESQGQLNNAADFGALVVAYRDGAPVASAISAG